MRRSQHVVPGPKGGWNVVSSGATKARKHFEDQDSAIAFARRVSKAEGVDVYVHAADGTVQDKHRYSPAQEPDEVTQQ
jgi:hypothetical protein